MEMNERPNVFNIAPVERKRDTSVPALRARSRDHVEYHRIGRRSVTQRRCDGHRTSTPSVRAIQRALSLDTESRLLSPTRCSLSSRKIEEDADRGSGVCLNPRGITGERGSHEKFRGIDGNRPMRRAAPASFREQRRNRLCGGGERQDGRPPRRSGVDLFRAEDSLAKIHQSSNA